MDVHSFINKLRENKKNELFVNDIKASIKVEKRLAEDGLKLEVPPAPADFRKKLQAKCIHGHVFEDYVLKAALEDGRKVLVVQDDTEATLKKQMKERKQEFKEIYDENPKKKYEASMTLAGTRAWRILSGVARNSSPAKTVSEVKFEDWVKNKISSELMGSLRADFVARTGDKVLLVDLKFSTTKRATYEEEYLIDGIIQVLIYAMLMGVKRSEVTLGVLVYYGREGEVVFYSTDKRNDPDCVKKLMQKAGIKKLENEEVIAPQKRVDNTAAYNDNHSTSNPNQMKGILKNVSNRRPITVPKKPKSQKAWTDANFNTEFSDDDDGVCRSDKEFFLVSDLSKAASLLVFVVLFMGLLGWCLQ